MMEQTDFQDVAVAMAQRQGRRLLRKDVVLQPEKAVPQAVTLIKDCIRFLGQPDLAIELALGFHPLALRWAVWQLWGDVLDMVLALDPHFHTTVSAIRLRIYRSHIARTLSDDMMAVQVATEALHMAEQVHDDVLVAEAHNQLGEIRFLSGDLVRAGTHYQCAYHTGQNCLPALELGHIALNLGTIAMHQLQFEQAHAHIAIALRHYRATNDFVAIAKAQCNRAELMRREGRLTEALEVLELASRTLYVTGARYDYGLVQNDIGCVYLSMQNWTAARQAFETGLAEFEHIGSLLGRAWILSNLAELYVTSEAWDLALPTLNEAYELSVACDLPFVTAAVDVDRGRMLLAQGDPQGAERAWNAALEIQEAKGSALAAQYTRSLLVGLGTDRQQ